MKQNLNKSCVHGEKAVDLSYFAWSCHQKVIQKLKIFAGRQKARTPVRAFCCSETDVTNKKVRFYRGSVINALSLSRGGTVLLLFLILFVTASIALPSSKNQASAATSTTINFQARLHQANGALVPDGDYNVEFKFYDTLASGGSAQGVCSLNSSSDDCWWLETRTGANKVRVVNGYLSVNLGSVTAFGSLNWDQEHWITMNIGGTGSPSWDGEMTPRMKLTAVPYAFKAGTAANVASNATTAASTNSNAVTIQSGNATGATSNSGNITLDVGTATGTAGTISIGTANTSGITIGRTGVTTTNVGLLRVGTGGSPSVATSNGDLYVQNDVEIGGQAYLSVDNGLFLGATRILQASSGHTIVDFDGGDFIFRDTSASLALFTIQNATGAAISIGNVTAQGGTFTAGTSGQAGSLVLSDGSSNTVTLTASGIGTNYSKTLPTGAGSLGDCLQIDATTLTQLVFGGCSAGSNDWIDGGSFLYPADLSGAEDIVIGGTSTGAADIWLQANGAAVFNEQSAAVNFRIESDNNANMLFVDGTNDRLGVGTASPTETLHVNGFIRTENVTWAQSYNGSEQNVESMTTFNGRLYAGLGNAASSGDIVMYDGNSWTSSYAGSQERITALTVYNGKLYAGQGADGGDGDVLVCDPTIAGVADACDNASDWSVSYNGSATIITALTVYNGKLYAGQGYATGDGDILVFDGSSWATSYNGSEEFFDSLTVYNGKLYAGQAFGTGDGDILVFDGSNWSVSYNGSQEVFISMAVYNGKLYAGQGNDTGDGDVYVFDGTTWSVSYNGAEEGIGDLTVYNGKLYAGASNGSGDGDVYVFDGSSWAQSYNGAQETITSMTVYNGKLYAGQGSGSGDGDIYVYSERLEAQLSKETNPQTVTPFNEQIQNFTKTISINNTLGSGTTLTVNNGTSTGDIAVFQDNGTAVLTIADGGAVTITNGPLSVTNGNIVSPSGGFGRYENLLTYSEQFDNPAWLTTSVSVAANNATAPDGSSTADTATVSVGGSHYLAQQFTTTGSTTYTFSIWAKAGTLTTPSFSVYDNTHSADIVASTTYTVGSIWQRYSVTFTTPSGTVSTTIFPLRDGAATGTIQLWGAQVEQASTKGVYVRSMGGSVAQTYGLAVNGNTSATGSLTLGASAGSGSLLTNNGATVNTTLPLTDDNNGGVLGSTAAATVDIYTSISLAQTTSSQSFTLASPTASTAYGRIVYVSNIGTASFTMYGTTISIGTTYAFIWSNTNGGAAWQLVSDGGANAALSNLSSVAINTSLLPGTDDAIDLGDNTHRFRDLYLGGETIHLGASTSDEVALGYTSSTDTFAITPATAGGIFNLGGSTQTGTISLGLSTASNTINIGTLAGGSNTQAINIGTSATASSTSNITIGSTVGGTVALQGVTTVTNRTSGSADTLVVSNSTSTGNIAVFKDNSTAVLTIADGGAATLKNQTNSTTAFQVQNQNGYNVFSVDTTNNAVLFEEAADNRGLGILTTSGGAYVYWYGALCCGGPGINITSGAAQNSTLGITGAQTTAGETVLRVDGSGTADLLQIRDNGSDVFKISDGGATIFQNTANSTAAVKIQNASGSSLFTVNTTSNYVDILSNNSPQLNAWVTNSNTMGSIANQPGAVIVNGYLYTIGGYDGADMDDVYYHKINADGSIGAAVTTTALPAARSFGSVATYNGYIYYVGGSASTTIYYARPNADGTISSWNTTTVLPEDRTDSTVLAVNGYLYVLAGSNNVGGIRGTSYYAKIYPNGTVGAWSTSPALPGGDIRADIAGSYSNGYMYIIGGSSSGPIAQDDVYYSAVNPIDGSLGTWTKQAAVLPGNITAPSQNAVVMNGNIYVFGGDNGTSAWDKVYSAPLNANGSTGTWITQTNVLPGERLDPMVVTYNGYVYVIGGDDDSNTHQNTIYYSSGSRLRVGGSLDLIGFGNGSKGVDTGSDLGSLGGSLTAGNGLFAGMLTVQGASVFNQSLYVKGDLVSNGSVTLKNQTNSANAFQIQNANTANIINVSTVSSTQNLLTNPSYESNSTGWTAINSGTISIATTPVQSGTQSLQLVTGANSNAGVKYVYNFKPSTTYTLSVYAAVTSGTVSTTFDMGTVQNGGAETTCTPSTTTLSGTLTRITCSFTTGGTILGSDYVYFRRTGTVSNTIIFDAAQLEIASAATPFVDQVYPNIVTNPDFESNTNGWAAKGSATISTSDSYAQFGGKSLKVVTTAATNLDGAKYAFALTASTRYTLSFYGRTSTGSYNVTPGRQDVSGSDSDCTTAAFTATWTNYTCTFTTGSTITSPTTIYFRDPGASHTFYIDGVTVVKGGVAQPYTATANGLQVEPFYSTISLNNGFAGEIQPWQANTNVLPANRSDFGNALYSNGYVYVIAGAADNTQANNTSTAYYAKVNADGSIGTWGTTTALPSGIGYHADVIANGYLYVLGGRNTSGTYVSTVISAKINTDGTLGSWNTNTQLPLPLAYEGVTTVNGNIYVIGGITTGGTLQQAVYYAKAGADGRITSWKTTTSTTGVISEGPTSVTTSNGYIYVESGFNGSNLNGTYYTQVNADGTLGTWATTSFAPYGGVEDGHAFASNGYLYSMGGYNGSALSGVYYAKINSDGTAGVWQQSANSLPKALLEGGIFGVNGYIYIVGGSTSLDAGATVNTIYYTSTARTQLAGSLDLVGFGGQTLGDVGGGGQLTAGNTTIVGSLDTRGDASFAQSVSVGSNLNVAGSTTLQTTINAQSAFQVQNQNATNIVNISTISNTQNLLTNPSFESNTTGWYGRAGTTTDPLTIGTTSPVNGTQTLVDTSLAKAYRGVKYNYTFKANTTYTFSVSAAVSSGTTGAFFTLGHDEGYTTGGFACQSNSGTSCSGVSGTEVFGVSTNFTVGMIGSQIVWNDGTVDTITNVTSTTRLQVTTSRVVAQTTNYEIETPADCSPSTNTLSTTMTRYSCTFTTASTFSPRGYSGVYARYTSATNAYTMYFDSAQLEASSSASPYADQPNPNMVANADFEGNANNWAAKGSATVSSSDDFGQFGSRSLKVVSTAASNLDGAKSAFPLTASTRYTLSFWGRSSTGSYNITAGRQDVSGTDVDCTTSAFTTTWTNYTCTFTTGATITTPTSIFFRDPSASHTFYIDGVTVVKGGIAQTYIATANNLQVDPLYNTITLNNNNTGEIRPWQYNNTVLPASRSDAASIVANGYFYSIGGTNGSPQSAVYYAKVNADGSLGSFSSANSLPVAMLDVSVATYNGYLYSVGGNNGAAGVTNIYYAKLNTDGSLGAWKTNPNGGWIGANLTTAPIINGYIYSIGGFNASFTAVSTVGYAKINADGSISPWTSTTSLPSAVANYPSVVANGTIYVLGGNSGGNATSTIYYARPSQDGTISSWTTASTGLPVVSTWGSATVVNGYVYMMGGCTDLACSTTYSSVYYAKLNSDGTIGTWNTSVNPLPKFANSFNSTTYNGYIYIGAPTGDNSILYTRAGSVTNIAGSLDLVAISGQNLADGASGGGGGGALTAGNTTVVGTLQVQDSAFFSQNVGVGGTLSVGNDISIGARSDSGGTSGDWALISTAGTPCSTASIDKATASAVFNGVLYVGTSESTKGEVCRYDGGTSWTRMNTSNTAGTFGSVTAVDTVSSMIVYNGFLYIGINDSGNGSVFRYDGGSTWTAINTTAGRFNTTTAIDGVTAMTVYAGYLYIGITEPNAAAVYRYDGGTGLSVFTLINTTAGTFNTTGTVDGVTAMATFGGKLYIGTNEAGVAQLLSYTSDLAPGAAVFTQINTTAGTFKTTAAIDQISSMTVYNGSLFFGVTDATTFAEVYRYDNKAAGAAPAAVLNTAGTFGATTSIDGVSAMTIYNGNLIIGTTEAGAADIYQYAGGVTWTEISSSGSAGQIKVTTGTTGIDGITMLIAYNDILYAGTNEANTAEIYTWFQSEGLSNALKFMAQSDNASTPLGQTTASIFFSAETSTVNPIQGMGGVFVFSHNIITTQGAYDVAEDYPTRDDTLRPGDLVAVDPKETGFVRRAQGAGDPGIIGIYSENPGIHLSQKDATINGGRAIPVALAGRVPMKVNNHGGDILPGDPIMASDVSGEGMKANGSARIVGMAMAPFSGDTSGTIVVFVNPNWYSTPVQGDNPNSQINSLIVGNMTVGALLVSGNTTLNTLVVNGTAEFKMNISVGGHIITAGEAPTTAVLPAVTGDHDTDAVLAIEGNDTAGIVTITAGQDPLTDAIAEITFKTPFTSVNGKPRITLTPINDKAAAITFYIDYPSLTNQKMTLRSLTPLVGGETYILNYLIVQ